MTSRSSLLLLGIFLACGPFLPAPATATLPAYNREVQQAWWLENDTPEDWEREAPLIHERLVEMQLKHGSTWAMGSKDFLSWMGHGWWLELHDPEHIDTPERRAAFVALAQEKHIPWRFLANLRAADDAPAALAILCDLFDGAPETVRRLPALAIATALVFDQPPTDFWPHPFVDRADVPWGKETPLERLRFFAESQKAGTLLYDLSKLGVNALTFVVDSPVALSELRHCQAFTVQHPDQIGKLYQAVRYDLERPRSGQPIWRGSPYTIANIAKRGGICADQAYLASTTFKSRGVPTILFMGQGDNGDHAWVGYRRANGSWNLEIARYRSEAFPVGQAVHPQTRLRISDAELESFSKLNRIAAQATRARMFLGWARRNPEAPFYGELVTAARRLVPQLPAPWELEWEWLQNASPAPDRVIRFLERWITNFDADPAMKFRGQKRLFNVLRNLDRHKEAEKLKKAILSQTKSKRFDLGIHLAAEDVFATIEKGDWRAAHKEFLATMKTFRGKTGGHLLYGLLQPYVLACLQERQVKLAEEALRTLRGQSFMRGTILWNDLQSLTRKVEQAQRGK